MNPYINCLTDFGIRSKSILHLSDRHCTVTMYSIVPVSQIAHTISWCKRCTGNQFQEYTSQNHLVLLLEHTPFSNVACAEVNSETIFVIMIKITLELVPKTKVCTSQSGSFLVFHARTHAKLMLHTTGEIGR